MDVPGFGERGRQTGCLSRRWAARGGEYMDVLGFEERGRDVDGESWPQRAEFK
jgi:hypothetical protein